ncbi:MAG: YifB family Mg chelatase-like AAA ATPase [Candidatus Yanofskybacteria bacterium]|nr:YifB family Mg chelatase-like AAA ATPase [Candidatus Yanofskybacteria bacterium]
MSVRLFSASIQGIEAAPIEVEIDSTPGLHAFNIVGLPDKAVEESKDRIAAAIRNSKLVPPNAKNRRFIVNLAPADIKKEGPSYDLPIAIGYLLETGQIKFNPEKKLLAGELSLDGSLKPTNGILSMAILAKNRGFSELIVPRANVLEASVIPGINVIGAHTILEVVGYLNGTIRINSPTLTNSNFADITPSNPFAYIQGQETAKRGLTVAAAGGHNVLMNGAPGSGKTLLAKAFRDLLPPLTLEESLEVAMIYSSVGLIKDSPLTPQRPFRSPHHTTSAVAITGGGTFPKPGEISLAHRGVLFLDELPEFPRNVLEALRQPLEDGIVTISRAAGSITLPAKFALVAAMNPCPCGNHGDENAACICPPFNVVRYRKKISGPLLDRMDIQLLVPREDINENFVPENNDNLMQKKIKKARDIQLDRFNKKGIFSNAEMGHKNIDSYCNLDPKAESILKQVINAHRLSLRSYHKIKKLSRTIADLEESETVKEHHVAEAISLRINEKMFQE